MSTATLTGGARMHVTDPATGHVIASVPDLDAAQAGRLVDAAADAAPAWAALPPRRRSEILRAAFTQMLDRSDEVAGVIMAENGKSHGDARAEVAYAAEFLRWYSEECVRPSGSYGPAPSGGSRTIVTQRPAGVAALVTPWNFPAAMAARKLAPALAAGCTAVLKPAEQTPLTALLLAEILLSSGVPEGAVGVATTSRPAAVVDAWLADPRVRVLSFTGSTEIGRHLLHGAADRVVNVSMELGGNAPFVVTADADVRAAVAGAVIAKFRNGGQACTAANRFLIHAAVAPEFVARFGAAIEALTVGPASAGHDIGPMIDIRAADRIRSWVAAAHDAGAATTHSSDAPRYPTFHPAVLLTGFPADSSLLQQEVFGPVAPVVTWQDESELLHLANGTEAGLTAYVFAGRLQDGLHLAEQLDVGMVGINRGIVSDPSAPFGGTRQSGIGREGARAGLEEFTETQYFSVDWG